MAVLNVAVLASGRGSNLQALLDRAAVAAGAGFRIALVVSDQPGAAALERAATVGVSAVAIEPAAGERRAAFDSRLSVVLERAGAELICLAGFMRILGPDFVDRWRGRLINIHPSLLPAYPGLDTHARVLRDGVRRHGCTVHWVRSEEVDAGPVIAQAAVPVRPGDDPATLAARVLSAEHGLYPEVVAAIAAGRLSDPGGIGPGGPVQPTMSSAEKK